MRYPLAVYLVTQDNRLLAPPWTCDDKTDVWCAIKDAMESAEPIPDEEKIRSVLIVKQKCCHGQGGEDMLTAYANFFVKGKRRPDDKNEYLEIEL